MLPMLCFLILAIARQSWASWELDNGQIHASIGLSAESSPAVRMLKDYGNGMGLQLPDLLSLKCGDIPGGLWRVKWNQAHKLGLRGTLKGCPGLTVDLNYSLRNRELVVESYLFATSPTELPQGIRMSLGSDMDSVEVWNHMGRTSRFWTGLRKGRLQFNQFARFSYGSTPLNLFFPSPFHALLRQDSAQAATWWDIAPTQPAWSPYSQEGSWSRLGPGDTLYRAVQLSLGETPSKRIYWSEHPWGWDQSVTAYFDELPNRDGWEALSTSSNVKTPLYSQLVSLLERYPRMKLGLVLLTDRDVERQKTLFTGWSVQHYQVLADTLDKVQGQASVLLMGKRDSDTLQLSQTVNIYDVTQPMRLALQFKAEQAQGQMALCLRYVYSGKETCEALAIESQWKLDTVQLAWPGEAGDYDLSLRSIGKGRFFIDDLAFVDGTGPFDSLVNGGFESYDAAYLYDNRRRHWSDAHGREYLPNAPASYLGFLRRLEQGEKKYGWEDRVSLGSHGLKHTSDIQLPDPEHEFSHYDEEGDSLRLARIDQNLAAIGLSHKSQRYWRPSGFRSTRSLVHRLAERGTVWLDPGWWSGDLGNSAFYIRRNGHTLWGKAIDFWMDRTEKGWGFGQDALWDAFRHGHLVHMGGHPEPMFSYRGSLKAIIELFDAMDENFPDHGYLFPDEYADYATSLSSARLQSGEANGSEFLQLRGSLKAGSTLVFDGYEFDDVMRMIQTMGLDCQWRRADQRTYVWLAKDWKGGRFYTDAIEPDSVPDATFDLKGRKLGQSKAWGLSVSRYEDSWSRRVEHRQTHGKSGD